MQMADTLYVKHTLCTGAKSGTSSDYPVIDDIHNALMNYIREQPSIWAPFLSPVSHFVPKASVLLLFLAFSFLECSRRAVVKDAASLSLEVS